jgi:hypothetical protein
VKLFVFDKPSQAWLEKGRGQLRLNDKLSSETSAVDKPFPVETWYGDCATILMS